MDRHRDSVKKIAAAIRQFHEQGQKWRVYHSGSNSTREPHRSSAIVDTSALSNVIKVDSQYLRATVEPNVPMGSLVKETLLKGLIPAVVMEFPAITVGGGFSGNSGESSSWRYVEVLPTKKQSKAISLSVRNHFTTIDMPVGMSLIRI